MKASDHRAEPWGSMNRLSYTLPSLISFEHDLRHRYMPGTTNAQAYRLPVLDFPLRKDMNPRLSTDLRVHTTEPGSSNGQSYTQEEYCPRHIRPVTALAAAKQRRRYPDAIVEEDAYLLYSAGCDGMLCAWELGSSMPKYRQHIYAHDDWVSSMVLCNNEQTIVSGSLDTTVKAWSPFLESGAELMEIGAHSDYVKDLAWASSLDCIVSGGLDADVHLWDLKHGRKHSIWHASCPAAIYSTGTNCSGSVIATGGVDHVVRGWDPRMRESTFNLVGHQDNIRSLLVSASGQYILSGSSDSTIRLWDVGEQRCVHTFTHHNSSIWSLYAANDDLTTFISGDRDGYLCKTYWPLNGSGNDAQCILLARELCNNTYDSHLCKPVQSITADRQHVWVSNAKTATISCWRNVEPTTHSDHTPFVSDTFNGVSYSHCINLNLMDVWDAQEDADQDDRLSGKSNSDEPQSQLLKKRRAFANRMLTEDASPLSTKPVYTLRGYHGVLRALVLNDRIHGISIDTGSVISLWNLVKAECIGTLDVDRVRDAAKAGATEQGSPASDLPSSWRPQDLPSDTLSMIQCHIDSDAVVASWGSLDTSTGEIKVQLDHDKIWAAEVFTTDIFKSPAQDTPMQWTEERISIGAAIIRNLFADWISAETLMHTQGGPYIPWLLQWMDENHATIGTLLNTPMSEILPPGLIRGSLAIDTLSSLLAKISSRALSSIRFTEPSQPVKHISVSSTHQQMFSEVVECIQKSLKETTMSNPNPKNSPEESSSPGSSIFGRRRGANSTRKAESAAPITEASAVQQNVSARLQLLAGPFAEGVQRSGMPQINYSPHTTILLSREHASTRYPKVVYRGRLGRIASDAPLLELLAPVWLLDAVLNQQQSDPAVQRISVQVQPFSAQPADPLALPMLPLQDAAFSVARMTRVARIATYVQGLLHRARVSVPPSPTDSPLESRIELLCNGQPLPPYSTLASCQRHLWKSSAKMQLQYRLK
ncbi:hypothetical protein MYAM1_000849 [Malassezia yamatoensis]|uniref:WD repeat-containing protein 48 n=1 Tax=Malassezia yamatoensis TaxID=253288 RepID=A0AAJ6CGC5_9BASI|nr:hypothetical protein MYAM1_000849 [Malassezia yamatoensis]